MLHTKDWLHWNGDVDYRNDTGDDCVGDVESHIEQVQATKDPECPEQWDVIAAPNVPRMFRPTRMSRRQPEKRDVTAIAIETWRNKGVKKM